MATDFEGLRARMEVLRLRVDIAKAGPFDPSKHPRFPKGSNTGGEFAPKGLSAWFANFFGQPKDVSDPNWAANQGPQVPWHTVERKGSLLHPFPDNEGRDAFIHRPNTPTPTDAPEWKSADGVVTVTPGSATPKSLNGIPFNTFEPPQNWATVAGQHPQLEDGLPDLESIKGMHPAAGVIIQEPDGRVWLTKPLNGYGGYKHTFPKGTQEEGLNLQQTAIKEAWEESGLKVELVGVLGDFKRTTSVARYFIARRVGGTPSKQGWESQAMRLVPPDKIVSFLNLSVDRDIWRAYKGEEDVTKARPDPFLGLAALHALQVRVDALAVKVGIEKAFDDGKHPRWPKGSPLGGQFMSLDAAGLPLPPTIGSKANPGYQKKVNAAYEAAKAGNTEALGALKAELDAKAAKYGFTEGAHPGVAYSKAPHSQGTWAQQAHQYVTDLQEKQKGASVANLMADGGSAGADPVSDLAHYKKIGGKLGGTSAGGQYLGPDGEKYYVKGTSGQGISSPDRAKNEVLSAKLLQAAGAGAPDMHLVTNLPEELGGPKAVGVASKLVTGTALKPGSGAIFEARKDFAAHAWLANYDVMGMGLDNSMVLPGGKVVNIDPGGALLHRAQGALKYPDLPYGEMPHNVSEWNTLRDKGVNAQTAAVYGGMTKGDLQASAAKLANLDDKTITDLVAKYGPGTPEQKLTLAHSLIQRRNDVLTKAGLIVAPSKIVAPTGGVAEYLDGKKPAGSVTPKPDLAPFASKVAHIKPLTGEDFHAVAAGNYAANMRLAAYKGDTGKIAELVNEAKVHPVIGGIDGDGGTADWDKLHKYGKDLRGALKGEMAGAPMTGAFTHEFAGSKVKLTGALWKTSAEAVDEFYKKDPSGDLLVKASGVYAASAVHATGAEKENLLALKQHADNLLAKLQHEAGDPVPSLTSLPLVTLHNTQPGHNKFWTAQVFVHDDGSATLEKKWGKIGTAGQSMTASYANAGEATAAAQKQINAKTAGGYAAANKQEPTYAGSGYQKANAARHAAAQAHGGAEKPILGVLSTKEELLSAADKAAAAKTDGLQAFGDMGATNAKIAEALTTGNEAQFKTNMGKLSDWATNKAGYISESGQTKAAAYLEHWNNGAKLTGWAPHDLNAAALASVEAHAQAKQILSEATGFTVNSIGHDGLHQEVLSAVHAFHAGDDKAMATSMGKIALSGYTSAEPVYDKLAALAQTKAEHFPLATGGQTAMYAHDEVHTDNAKPDAISVASHPTTNEAPKAPVKPSAPPLPNFQHTTKTAVEYYNGIAQKMQDAYAKGDLSGLLGASGKAKAGTIVPAWPVFESGEKIGLPKTINGKLLADYQTHLVEQLNNHNAAKLATELEKPVPSVAPGEHAGNYPAMPSFDRAQIATTNSNAASHNAKVYQIKTLALKGDVKGLLALNYGTNTYGKKQAILANNALAALGSDLKVVPGQKKNSHFALTSTGNLQEPTIPAGKTALSAALSDKELPAKIDFANYKGPGSGLSSKAFVNKANQQAFDHLVELGKKGDIAGIKNATFQPINPETGEPVGKPLPISQHPSQHIKNTQITLLQTMDEKLHPPEPLKFFAGQSFKDIHEVSQAIPPKAFGTTKAKHPASQTIGYFLALGQVNDPTALVPDKTFNLTGETKAAASKDYNKMSSDAKAFVSTMQSSGGKKFANPESGGGGFTADKWEKVTVAAHKYATELPVGTTLYKWDNLTPDMKQKLSLSQPGLIIQNPAPVCTSYNPTSTKGFGSSHRFKIIVGKGAKVISSFGSGHFAGEGELSLLPNNRLMVISHKKNAGEGWAETTVLLLPPDPALEKKAKALPF